MKKIIVLTLMLFSIVFLLAGCVKQETIGGSNEIVAVIPIEANRIKVVHEIEKNTADFEVTITNAKEIENTLSIYNSMKIGQISKPLNTERFVITFYLDGTEIAVWWVDSDLITAGSGFDGGNHVIENEDFNFNYFEELLKR